MMSRVDEISKISRRALFFKEKLLEFPIPIKIVPTERFFHFFATYKLEIF